MTLAASAAGLGSAPIGRSGDVLPEVLPWLLALAGFVVVGTVVLTMLRRRLGGASGGDAGGFTLHDLRQLHAAGELTDEEFERAKAAMIAGVRGPEPDADDDAAAASENPPDAAPSDPEDPNNPSSM